VGQAEAIEILKRGESDEMVIVPFRHAPILPRDASNYDGLASPI